MPSAHGSPSHDRLERAEQPRHVRVAGPAEHPVELDVGVDAGGDPAEHLEDGLLLEDHAGVALLGVEDPRRGVQRQLGVGLLVNVTSPTDGRRRSISDSRYCAAAGSYRAS